MEYNRKRKQNDENENISKIPRNISSERRFGDSIENNILHSSISIDRNNVKSNEEVVVVQTINIARPSKPFKTEAFKEIEIEKIRSFLEKNDINQDRILKKHRINKSKSKSLETSPFKKLNLKRSLSDYDIKILNTLREVAVKRRSSRRLDKKINRILEISDDDDDDEISNIPPAKEIILSHSQIESETTIETSNHHDQNGQSVIYGNDAEIEEYKDDSSSVNNTIDCSKTVKKNQKYHDKIIEYIVEQMGSIFTVEEISTGIFGDKDNKTKSKTRTVFDKVKTEKLKDLVKVKFSIKSEDFESMWNKKKTAINQRISQHCTTIKFKIQLQASKN